MCKFKAFCGCFSLRTAAIIGFILSLFFCAFIAIVSVCRALNLTYKENWKSFPYVVMSLFTILMCFMFIAGTVCLLFAILKERERLVIIWLVTSIAYAVWTVIWLALTVYTKEGGLNIFITVVLIIVLLTNLLMIYVWLGVLNYYRELKAGIKTYSFAYQ